jgi:electron transport complex protein RnfD
MTTSTTSSPFLNAEPGVPAIMRQVLAALAPGAAVLVWQFGAGVLINVVLCAVSALAAEALTLRARGRPLRPYLGDASALVTAALLGLALPPLTPWWIPVLGTLFAVVVAKQLYGGIGYNPFNPAMAGYALLLIAFPLEMSRWPAPAGLIEGAPGWAEALRFSLTGHLGSGLDIDAVSMATALDYARTELTRGRTLQDIASAQVFGPLGGRGAELVNLAFLAGGSWMLWRGTIRWHIPAAVLAGLMVPATAFWIADPLHHLGPVSHAFSGAAMLGAFFIATDPVTASTTPRGRIIYGAGCGLITFAIRTWGGYPDGIAFAVLLMNMAVPTIDHFTRPRVFGRPRRGAR